ncbi:hypothetical protein GQ457_04G020040 [Hibiscus cannabinus]
MWTARGASYTYPCTCTTCVAALACFGHVEETLAQAKHVASSTSPFHSIFSLPNGVKTLFKCVALIASAQKDSFQLKEAGTPSASSFQLIEAPFSSTSAQLAQLKLNNPEVAETHPVQERVSYEHVDSKRGVLHLSMHMHNMCSSLGMLWACGRDLGTSQACGWLNEPISLHLFPPKWNSLTTFLDS